MGDEVFWGEKMGMNKFLDIWIITIEKDVMLYPQQKAFDQWNWHEEFPNVKLNSWCEHKGCCYMNINESFASIKINTLDVHAKFALEWQSLMGVNSFT